MTTKQNPTTFQVTAIPALNEDGAANDIVLWEHSLNEAITIKIFIEKDGKTEISIEMENETLSHTTNPISAIELAQNRLLSINKVLSSWKDQYSPVIIKDDIVDFWYTNKEGNEVADFLIVPWATQEQGAHEINEFITRHLAIYDHAQFTQTW